MKQVFEANTKLRRVICAVLVAIMVIGMIPLAAPKAAAALKTGDKIYLQPNDEWKKDGARFAAYFFNGNGEPTWMSMFAEGDYYWCQYPDASYKSVIFCRMKPNNTTNDWNNKWNQTGDLVIPTDGKNCYVLNNGTWSTYGSQTGNNYYLIGNINGSNANVNDKSRPFVNGTFTMTFTSDSYVYVSDNNNTEYMTNGWLGKDVTSANLLPKGNVSGNPDKLYVPKGTVTFTLVDNGNGSLTLSYTTSGGEVTEPSNPSQPDEVTYYLIGWINASDYGANGVPSSVDNYKKYPLVNGTIDVEFTDETWVWIIDSNGQTYNANGSISNATSAVFNKGTTHANKLKIPHGEDVTITLVKNSDGSLTLSYTTSGGGTIDPDARLYVGTTFYDYRSDYEHTNGNGSLANRNAMDHGDNKTWPYLYNFTKLNSKLSKYYSDNGVKVPIYMGHFQPDSYPGWYDYKDYGANHSGYTYLYGYDFNNENRFMSVNNSLIDINNGWNDGHIYSAAWGIVAPALDGDKLMAATNSGTIAHPLFDEDFLKTTYSGKQLADIYSSVKFPFKQYVDKNGIEYWVFNSEETTLKMAQNDDGYYLEEVSNPGEGFMNRDNRGGVHSSLKRGFFPFNTGNESNASQYNYGYGMRLDIPFNLTADGKIANEYGDKQDVIYTFSGDDDVWVFIDGVLVLDIGGSHGKVTGEINFATKTATVSSVKASLGDTSPDDEEKSINGYQTKFTLPKDMAGEHTLTMFYMERGMWESNMSISFNFIPASSLWEPTTSFSVMKQWNVADTNVIPSSVTVQLQRRLQGAGTWTAVENKILTRENQSVQRVDNVWVYTWENLPNFEDETLYEYRVVELDADNNVLSNGATNSGMMVAYGDVSGSGATGYTQIISNNQVENNIVVVIDFGLSVDVTVIDEGNGTLVGVGNTLKLPVGLSNDLDDDNVVDEVEGLHGVATKVGNKIRYTPNSMKMDSADNIGFCLMVNNSTHTYTYSTLTVIPAANIYYEDNFLNFSHATNATESFGRWGVEGTASDKIQAEDRPGALTSNDANNVYGYDQAYDNFTTYSLGSARKVTVNAATGKPSTAPTASFSFTGTGFDVVSLTNNTSGAISVEVKRGNAVVLRYIVNNFYGMIYDNGSWIVDKSGKENALYQVPVIKVENLQYGTYDVTIRAAYMDIMDKTAPEGYTIWVDAIRIYNPALNDKTSNDAYLADGESNPHLTTLKKLLVDPGFDAYYDVNADVEINGVVFVEGKDDVVSMAEYANQGPNNETYLKNGNSVVFKFRIKDVVDPDVGPQIGLQIGAKLAIGDEATLKVALNNSSEATTVVTTRTATNMFYKLPQITWEEVDGGWESCPIMFKCEAAEAEEDEEDNILSLTDLKLTGPDADFATYVNVSDEDNTEEANIQTFVDYECYSYAVNVMSAPVVNPVTLIGNSFSLSFEDEILVNYYYAISDVTNVTEHGMLVFNTDPGAADIAKADQKYDAPVFVESDNLYACTTSGIAAKEMGDTRYYCAYAKLADGTIVYSDLSQYSPKHYAMSRLENSENENLKALCVAMLNYGAAAQSYFGYKTDALMNADLTDAQKALVGEYNADLFTGAVAADPAKVNGCFASTEAGFEQISASVSFEGAFALNFYFDLDRENSEVVFYYWTKEAYDSADELSDTNCTGSIAATADANGIFYAPITGIAAKELDDTVYVAATYTIDGETFCSGVIAYSLSTYCMRHANGNMGQLAQATAMYGYYAENYFGVSSQELI